MCVVVLVCGGKSSACFFPSGKNGKKKALEFSNFSGKPRRPFRHLVLHEKLLTKAIKKESSRKRPDGSRKTVLFAHLRDSNACRVSRMERVMGWKLLSAPFIHAFVKLSIVIELAEYHTNT